jgi:hypothetical protein
MKRLRSQQGPLLTPFLLLQHNLQWCHVPSFAHWTSRVTCSCQLNVTRLRMTCEYSPPKRGEGVGWWPPRGCLRYRLWNRYFSSSFGWQGASVSFHHVWTDLNSKPFPMSQWQRGIFEFFALAAAAAAAAVHILKLDTYNLLPIK